MDNFTDYEAHITAYICGEKIQFSLPFLENDDYDYLVECAEEEIIESIHIADIKVNKMK